jgi:hypothetical protein
VSPWVIALRLAGAFPAAVRGPVLALAFARFRARRSFSFAVSRRVTAPLRWVAGRSVSV